MDSDNYDVQVLDQKRWVVQTVCAREAEARKLMEALVKSRQYEGVRIVRDRTWSDGRHTEKVLATEMCDPREMRVTIIPIEDAPDCEALDDFYALPARMTMGRLLRKYLDAAMVTPMELLYNYGVLRRMTETDMLLASAVDRIAVIQAKRLEMDMRARADELHAVIDRIGVRASRAEGMKAARRLKVDSLSGLLKQVDRIADPGEEDYLLRVVLCRELSGRRDWMGKLYWLLELVDDALGARELEALDEFVADLMGAPPVIQEVLGPQTNLARGLCAMLDLMEGRLEEGALRPVVPETIQVLCKLFKEGKLPSGQTAIFDKVRRQVESRHPLSRNDPDKEAEAFELLLKRLLGPEGLRGGPDMAVAMTKRYMLRLEQGGAKGERQAISGMLSLLPNRAQRIRYLLQLSKSEFSRHMADIVKYAWANIRKGREVRAFCEGQMSPKDRLLAVSTLQRGIQRSALPEGERAAMVDALDDMLVTYLEEAGVVERLDNPDDPVRSRALRLVQFCGSGILLEGKALKLARERVVHHLRQPQFVERFTDGIPQAAAREKAVRDFYQLLARAGFKN